MGAVIYLGWSPSRQTGLLPPEQNGKPVKMEYLLVDTGLLPEEVATLVRPGDLVSFATEPMDLTGGVLAGHSLDDRAAVAAVTLCLQELQHMRHAWDVWAVASVQEEETLGGALTSPFSHSPGYGRRHRCHLRQRAGKYTIIARSPWTAGRP